MPGVTSALQIRPATEADVPLVFGFIRKLAEYGDLSDEVSAVEADVRAALFGTRPVAEAALAYWGSEPAGFALYSYTFSSFLGKTGIYIEDLYVEQGYRNKGIGKALLVHLARLGRRLRLRPPGVGGAQLERARHGVLPGSRRRADG